MSWNFRNFVLWGELKSFPFLLSIKAHIDYKRMPNAQREFLMHSGRFSYRGYDKSRVSSCCNMLVKFCSNRKKGRKSELSLHKWCATSLNLGQIWPGFNKLHKTIFWCVTESKKLDLKTLSPKLATFNVLESFKIFEIFRTFKIWESLSELFEILETFQFSTIFENLKIVSNFSFRI